MRLAYVIPAYQASSTVSRVITDLLGTRPILQQGGHTLVSVICVDDGSNDETGKRAAAAGAKLVQHNINRGKGRALLSGFEHALELGAEVAVSVDADGQHPACAALALALHPAAQEVLVLGVRAGKTAAAPRLNQAANGIANVLLNFFSGRTLSDTQCGLRRYPLPQVLSLGVRSSHYAYEAEVLLRAVHAGWSLVEAPVQVHYPPRERHVSHFHVARDPWRIIVAVVRTLIALHVLDRKGH